MSTSNAIPQNYFSTSLASPLSASDTVVYLSLLPTATEGWLEIDEGTSNKEIIYYTSKGANFVTLPSVGAGRGVGGTTAVSHATGATVKMKLNAEWYKALQSGDGFNAGVPVQIVSTNYSAVATGTALIPKDDTIPQISEGTEFMTQAITPKSATNRLLIEVKAFVSHSVGPNDLMGALFQDSTANALAATAQSYSGATYLKELIVRHDMVAGTISATTFRLRAGAAVAGTLTFNGQSAARLFGGITLSNIKITEYKA